MIKGLIVILMVVSVSLGLVFVGGCESDAQTGALIGTAIGAGAGQAIGGDTESTLIGAGAGAVGGYIIGNESDKKKAQAARYSIREEMKYVAVDITNSNGSISQVRLRKYGVGYVGTRGEYYDHLPTQDELRPIYGF